MLCDSCLLSQATSHVTDVLQSGETIERQFCVKCCTSVYFKTPLVECRCPRPRLTLRMLFVAVALFGITNGTINRAARNALKGLSADEASARSWSASITLNCSLAVVLLYAFLSSWLRKVAKHARTQGEIPMARNTPLLCARVFRGFRCRGWEARSS